MAKFQAGDKVRIPKTKGYGDKIDECYQQEKAVLEGLDCMYVIRRRKEDSQGVPVYVLNTDKKSNSGSIYLETDLVPYVVDVNEAFTLLVKGKITEYDYQQLTSSTT